MLQNNSTFKWQNRPRTSKRQPEAGLLTYSHLHSFVTLVRSQSSLVLLGKKQKKWGVYQRLRLTCLCNTHTSRILVNMVHTANHDRSRERHHSASSRVTDKESVHVYQRRLWQNDGTWSIEEPDCLLRIWWHWTVAYPVGWSKGFMTCSLPTTLLPLSYSCYFEPLDRTQLRRIGNCLSRVGNCLSRVPINQTHRIQQNQNQRHRHVVPSSRIFLVKQCTPQLPSSLIDDLEGDINTRCQQSWQRKMDHLIRTSSISW